MTNKEFQEDIENRLAKGERSFTISAVEHSSRPILYLFMEALKEDYTLVGATINLNAMLKTYFVKGHNDDLRHNIDWRKKSPKMKSETVRRGVNDIRLGTGMNWS